MSSLGGWSVRTTRRPARVAVAVGVASVFALAACSSSGGSSADAGGKSSATPAAPATPATHVVTDLSGATVTVPTTVNRIAEQFPAHVVADIMLGVGDKLVAIPQNVSTIPFLRTVQPSITKVPQLFHSGNVNMEQLLAQKPDVVSAISGGDTVKPFQAAGIPAVTMFFPKYAQLQQSTTVAGETYGGAAVARAKAYNAYFDKVDSTLTSRLAKAATKPTVVYIEAYTGNNIVVQGGSSLIDQWITKAGGTDAAKGISGGRVNVTMEQLLQWNPDNLIIQTPGGDQGLAADTGASVLAGLSKISGWSDLKAVKSDKVFIDPSGLYAWGQYTVEQALQLQWVAKVLNPSLFADVDLRSVTRDFYKNHFGYTPSDTQLNTILQTTSPDGIATAKNAIS
ncbi:ABC transporter substrate-binding protein [Frankia alni]|uniref:ABC transporter substrate-binding protein n=1 Tax=Frankia alni TaxID=1859 RepID=UPI001E53F95A|nr:ABC transporter substrate-binding protein [Frankia alni]